MPIVRYRTRDLTRLLPGTARSMRRMEKVTGRSDDMMIIRGVNIYPTQIEDQILRVKGLSGHYQIVLTRRDRLDEMEVVAEATPEAASAERRAALSSTLAGLIKSSIGSTAAVSVREPGGVERSQGKAQRVIDKRMIA